MTTIVYILSWGLVFATSSGAAKVTANRLHGEGLPDWMRRQHGAKEAYLASIVAFLSAISLVFWGALSIRCYFLPLAFCVGLLL